MCDEYTRNYGQAWTAVLGELNRIELKSQVRILHLVFHSPFGANLHDTIYRYEYQSEIE